MEFQGYVDQVIAFVRDNAAWAPPIVFALAFGESLAFISLLIPAWGALVAIGALIGPSGINFWPVWIAGALGAAFGDWLSYWIGLKLEHSVAHMWPLSRHPDLIPRGEAFMKKWGVLGIFIGRFFGPLRASVPLIAGIFEMPFWRFQLANFSSAFVWAAVLLTIGDVIRSCCNGCGADACPQKNPPGLIPAEFAFAVRYYSAPSRLELDHVDAGQRNLVNDRTGQNVIRSLVLIGVIARHSIDRHDDVEATQSGRDRREQNAIMRRDTNRNEGFDALVLQHLLQAGILVAKDELVDERRHDGLVAFRLQDRERSR